MRRALKKIKLAERCPCNSGLQYKGCCKKLNILWAKDVHADRYISMLDIDAWDPALLMRAVEIKARNFEAAFGRRPTDEDLIWLELDQDEHWDFQVHLGSALAQVGVPRELRSVFMFADDPILGKRAREILSSLILPRMAELCRRAAGSRSGLFLDYKSPHSLFDAICNVALHCLRKELTLAFEIDLFTKESVSLCFLTKSLRTFRSIFLLSRQGAYNDCLTLIRSLYETYVLLLYILTAPDGLERALIAPFRLRSGQYEHPRKSTGGIDRSRAQEKSTLKVVRLINSKREMIDEVGDDLERLFYKQYYEHFSSRAHPDFIIFFEGYWDNENFLFEHGAGLAFMMAVPIMLRILNKIKTLQFSDESINAGITHLIERSANSWSNILCGPPHDEEADPIRRVALIMIDWLAESAQKLGDEDSN
jgi:hypothetical protein